MNTAAQVDDKIAAWKNRKMQKSELVTKLAQACIGWSYVFAAAGGLCNTKNRRSSYNGNLSRHPEEADQIKKKCQVLSGKATRCDGCKYYPGGNTRFYDCRGFTRWVMEKAGITITGGGCSTQWNTAKNWKAKGKISDMPQDKVCCVFMRKGEKMSHTGLHIGGGVIIHCSGEVKRGKTTDRGWTDYAIPKGMDGEVPDPPAPTKPLLRRGSAGAYVLELQKGLLKLGYDIGQTGADSKYGRRTETGVKAFQSKSGLKSDGICGPMTWAALDKALKEKE